ncbi:MAG: carboxypeptidase-like regulatory domain-containing protein [Gemmatimonadaceae bacterium]
MRELRSTQIRPTISLVACVVVVTLLPASLAAQATEPSRGRVEDALRRPIDNAQVELKLKPNERRVVTNASGAFVFNNVARGTHELRVRRLGYEPEAVLVRVDGANNPPVVITLTAIPLLLASIRVLEKSGGTRYGATVTDQFDQPIAGANVVAEGIDARLRTVSRYPARRPE